MSDFPPIVRETAPPDGFEWRWMPDTTGFLCWELADPAESRTYKCRTSTVHPCPNPPVAKLYRGSTRQRWFYCADHMYGRIIRDGVIYYPRLMPKDAS